MYHGKRGFDRLLHACRTVLDEPVTWLFCDLLAVATSSSTPTAAPGPVAKHNPTTIEVMPSIHQSAAVLTPPLAMPSALPQEWDRELLQEFAADTYEWLSLVRLQSPRVLATDDVDPYISSYCVPAGDSVAGAIALGDASSVAQNSPIQPSKTQTPPATDVDTGRVCVVSWQGLLSSAFVRELLVSALQAVPSAGWFSLSATTFAKGLVGDVDETCVLRMPGSQAEYLLWEIRNEAA